MHPIDLLLFLAIASIYAIGYITCYLQNPRRPLNYKITSVVSELMDVIEKHAPDYYSRSDEIMRADDFLKELENL